MATTSRKSLVARAGAAARKVVSRAPGSDLPEEQPPAESTAAKKAPTKKAPTKKAPARKASAKKTAASKAATKKAPAKKAPAKKTSGAAKAPARKTSTRAASTAAAKKATPRSTGKAAPSSLAVLDQESPWTAEELASVRQQLEDDVARLSAELAAAENDLAGMIQNSNEGAGNDQADVGSASFERDQEIVVVNNAREMLVQSEHALERIDEGTYGKCESCGNAIGKNRLMAFPRATLCLACKQLEERR